MSEKTCKDCGQPIAFYFEDGRWKPVQPGTTEPHWKVCSNDDARHRRQRNGLEPGLFPFSPSRWELYNACPLAYKRRYLDHIPEPYDPRRVLGSLAHARQAHILRSGRAPSLQQLLEEERTHFPLELAHEWAWICRVMDATDWDTEDAAIEESQSYSWQDGAVTVEYEIKIDYWRVADPVSLVCTDFKTSWQVPSPTALRSGPSSVQSHSYPLVLLRNFPQFEHFRFQLVPYRLGGEPIGVDFTAEELYEWEECLRAEAGRILRDTEFKPNPYCKVCPIGVHPNAHYSIEFNEGVITVTPPMSQEQADLLGEFNWQAKRWLEASRDELRVWCEEHQHVGPLGFWPHQRRGMARFAEDEAGLSQPTIYAVLKLLQSDRSWQEMIPTLLTLDGSELRKILDSKKKWKRLAAALEPYLETWTEVKFEYRNGGYGDEPEQPNGPDPQPDPQPALTVVEG